MGKIFNRRIIQVNDELTILCESEDTRSGFRHVAHILRNGYERRKPVKICYLNRTWESFEFESVLHRLADVGEGLTKEERTAILNIKRGG